MLNFELTELLQQDMKDLNGLFNFEKYGLSLDLAKLQANGILANLKDHLKELFKVKV